MSGLQALESVRFVAVENRRFAVLNADDWDALVEWLETLDDAGVAGAAIRHLKANDGDRERAGWQSWDAISDQLL